MGHNTDISISLSKRTIKNKGCSISLALLLKQLFVIVSFMNKTFKRLLSNLVSRMYLV